MPSLASRMPCDDRVGWSHRMECSCCSTKGANFLISCKEHLLGTAMARRVTTRWAYTLEKSISSSVETRSDCRWDSKTWAICSSKLICVYVGNTTSINTRSLRWILCLQGYRRSSSHSLGYPPKVASLGVVHVCSDEWSIYQVKTVNWTSSGWSVGHEYSKRCASRCSSIIQSSGIILSIVFCDKGDPSYSVKASCISEVISGRYLSWHPLCLWARILIGLEVLRLQVLGGALFAEGSGPSPT